VKIGKLARLINIGYTFCKLAAGSGEEFLQKERIDEEETGYCYGRFEFGC
jgi:hypothetical protein